MAETSEQPRLHDRTPLDGWADYRQGSRFGSWVLLDVSRGGLCACGDLDGLDVEDTLDVELRSTAVRVPIRMRLRWQRYDPTGVCVHGWEFLDDIPDMDAFIASLSRSGE